MTTWGWVLVALIAVTAVQLLVYHYLRGHNDALFVETSPSYAERFGAEEGREARGGGEARCPHCGAENDPEGGYTYCKRCVKPLQILPTG